MTDPRILDAYPTFTASATDQDRLPPAIAPDGTEFDHDCPFRRMLRDIATRLGVPPSPNGGYDALDLAAAIEQHHIACRPEETR